MALPTTGALSLNAIHIEAGGSSGTSCGINDSDIRALIGKGSGVTMAFSEWYGASSTPISASGGSIVTSGGFRYHRFTSNGTFSISSIASGGFSNNLTIFILGGGGGSSSYIGGGGGGGVAKVVTVAASTGNKTVTIGNGGADGYGPFPNSAQGSTGGTSSITNLTGGTVSAGGGVGSYNRYFTTVSLRQNGGPSGSGNLGGQDYLVGDGGSSGGGGGQTAVGQTGTSSAVANGGAGYTLSGFTTITSTTKYGGGGGGVRIVSDTYVGQGSGVDGGASGSSGTSNAVANRGGGGGGSWINVAGDGGSGLVMIKYAYS